VNLNKRQRAQIEKRLIKSLTAVCEIGKQELPGFRWLTHMVDYKQYPESLMVLWIFDTLESLSQARAAGLEGRMRALTAEAFVEAQIPIKKVDAHVSFDHERNNPTC
jgi:hypothetical protein